MTVCKSYHLFGLGEYHRVLDDILASCPCSDDHFAVSVLTTEALTNAFVHGNACDSSKPIHMSACFSERALTIRVEDNGTGFAGQEREEPTDPWSGSGRGIPLMKHYADELIIQGNTVTITKNLGIPPGGMTGMLAIDISKKGGIVCIILPERFTYIEADDLRQRAADLLQTGETFFNIEFAHCDFIDSTGLGVLVTIYKKCLDKQGRVTLSSMTSKQVKEIFKLTKLDCVFEIED